ncbi:MAG: hypothetical protein QOJ73_1205 [Streptosporangiaceae bacterium]|jgi:hypothetical protein|nr:hypothetical protein [Streptosporangiaceae bacterium]
MTIVVQFVECGTDPVLVFVGLAGSSTVDPWPNDPTADAAVTALDRVPWGTRPATDPDAVRAVGDLLRTKLVAVPTLKHAMVDAFAGAPAVAGARPIFFRVGNQTWVEAYPFEALWDDHNATFPGLQPSWPIARIPGDTNAPVPFNMEPTVRVVAVLAAESVPADKQVAAIETACATQPGLTIEVTVITSSTALRDAVNAAARPGWQAELVPASGDDLILRLIALQPHLLHLFCHGTANGSRLFVAQRDDLAVLELGAAQFAELARPSWIAPWLVTLNCCETGGPGTETASLTSSLVRSGLPAALGMRKAVDSAMADAFCADLYRAVFAHLTEIAPSGRAGAALDWPRVLQEPRRRLCAMHGDPAQVAGRQKEWTMPVLYVASPTMWIRGRPSAALTSEQVRQQQTTLVTADGLFANGQLTLAMADAMRTPALATLYPPP